MPQLGDVVGRGASAASDLARKTFSRSAIPTFVAVGVVAAAVGAFALAGGFNAATPSVEQVEIGTEVSLPLYSITVKDAEIVSEVEDNYMSEQDGQVIIVATVVLENLTNETIGVDRALDRIDSRLVTSGESLIDLDGIESVAPGAAWRAGGSVLSVKLQPGIPTEVMLGWYVEEADLAGGDIGINLYDATPRGGQVLISEDTVSWGRDKLIAHVDLDLP